MEKIRMKKLGFGLMRLPLLEPSKATSVDMEQLKVMVDKFIEKCCRKIGTLVHPILLQNG